MGSPGSPQALTAAQATQLEAVLRLLQAGKAADALPIARRLAVDAARAPDAHQLLAMCQADSGNVGEADKAFLRALELAPNNPLLLVNHATMLRRAGRLEEALAGFGRAVVAAPTLAKAWIELGLTALQAGRPQPALAALGRAVELQPDSALAWHALGSARRMDDDLEAAEAAFARAASISPDYGSAWVNLGVVRRLLGRPDEAIASFQQAAKAGVAGADVADTYTGALLESGRLGEALEQAQRLTREHPDFVPGHVTLANLLWEYGPASAGDDAIATFRAAVRERPQDRELRLAFARFLLSARMADDTLEQIRFLQATGDDPVLTAFEANALEILGRTEPAAVLYEKLYRAIGRSDPGFLNAYVRHLLRTGKWAVAAERASEAVALDPLNQESWAYLATAWRLLDDPREHWLCDYERLISLVEVEPPAEFADTTAFLQALKSALEPLHRAKREPVVQSLRGGSQTPGRLFGRRDPVIAATQSALLRAVERWLATLPADDRHPFLARKTDSVRFAGSWSVKLWSSGSHVNHIHSQGWMSSAFYVSLPPSVESQSGAGAQAGYIQFGQPPLELGLELPPRRVIRPEPGKLALFPSFMWHGTVPFEDEQPRVTVAFDMTPFAGSKGPGR